MNIRNLVADDYKAITKLWTKAGLPFKSRGRDNKKAITTEMAANPDFFLGALENKRIVGVVVLTSDCRKGWINRLAVDPECRRREIAQALIVESERVFKRRGLRIFCALIEDGNSASVGLFKKCGYVEHRDIVYFSKRDSDEV